MPLFPGSLNLALGATFDWFAPEIARRTIHFDHAEYSGERDILLATAARDRSDPWVIEVIAAKPLRQSFHLVDGSSVIVELPDPPYGTDQGTKMMP
ncbi:MAG: hypothetical protein ABJD11_17290 [Gemmatimonadota bacterium]